VRYFLNNAQKRPHASWYGADAFYDLHRTGHQSGMLRELEPGDVCVVATPVSDNRIAFESYAFRRETEDRGERGQKFRVFRGEHLRSEQLAKTTATETEPYRIFFDINGNFKRQSVLRK